MSGTDFYYENMVTLGENAFKDCADDGHTVYYGNSGAEAVEAAMKLARYHTKRQGQIAFYGAFHGRTMGALSLTASKAQQRRRFFPAGSRRGARAVSEPVSQAGRHEMQREYRAQCAKYIEEWVFRTEVPPEECAAIVVEAFQGEGGYLPAPTEFMQELRRICDRHGIMLIVDEVQSGVGRTGKWWAVEHTGVEPDMITIAKGIASGMPLSVTMSRAELMDWVPGSHASTFGGNPVCIAAALATMNVLEREGVENSRKVGSHMLKRRIAWTETHCRWLATFADAD